MAARGESLIIKFNAAIAFLSPEILAIPAEKLEELRRRMRMDDRQVEEEKGCHGGTGLRNVNRRIQLRYGDEYGLQIESMAGRGTVVTVRFPAEGGSYDPDASC